MAAPGVSVQTVIARDKRGQSLRPSTGTQGLSPFVSLAMTK